MNPAQWSLSFPAKSLAFLSVLHSCGYGFDKFRIYQTFINNGVDHGVQQRHIGYPASGTADNARHDAQYHSCADQPQLISAPFFGSIFIHVAATG
jgi:hypothetical protein